MRIGVGYDVHRLVKNRDLIIGGIKIDNNEGLGLLGHSDADVLIHAIMDALLGALALGDIGDYFPDTDEKYRGISSTDLLVEVLKKVEDANYFIENIDCILVAQRPKISPYKKLIRDNLSNILGIDIDRINIKATTEEGLGFTGRLEGISAKAICLLDRMYDFDTKTSCGGCCGHN